MFLAPQTSKLEGHPKLKILASTHPGAWPQDVKTFESDVLGSKNFEFEGFNILGRCHWMQKRFDLDVFESPNLQTGESYQIEDFSIHATEQMAPAL